MGITHKKIAKSKRYYKDNLGNKIDKVIQNSQDGQTKGIPISPDTSFAIGEIISTAIDMALIKQGITKYHRYIDDYEFGCSSYQDAENKLSILQEILESYELSLNPNKTSIIKLSDEIKPFWIKELSKFEFSDNPGEQKNDLYDYFDLSVRCQKKTTDEPIIQYALKKILHLEVSRSNWGIYQNILLQWGVLEPSILHFIIDLLFLYKKEKYPLNEDAMKDTFTVIIESNSSVGHIGEVAWALWACILFKININHLSETLAKIENPVIALLTLDAQKKELIDKKAEFRLWKNLMVQEELKNENWLLTYEAYANGWLPSVSGVDYIKNSDDFDILHSNDVKFYDIELSNTYKPNFELINASDMNIYSHL